MSPTSAAPTPKLATGVAGLDDILTGGLPQNRMYLLQGDPGVGKTTMAIQFLLTGVAAGENCLYVTLSETREELDAVARSHGWNLEGIAVYEMYVGEASSAPEEEENTLYVPAEVELGERMRALLEEVDRVKPSRLVLDSCSELRLLAQSPLRFRRQLLALKADLVRRQCTVLLLENPTSVGGDPLLQSLVHGVVAMEQLSPIYGAERRRLRITKLREVAFRGGFHDMKIQKQGVVVFPRLVAAEHKEPFAHGTFESGVPEVDALLGGGLDRGTSCLVVGPAGSGKSALATQYAVAAARRGERSAFYVFDEGVGTLMGRAAATGMDLAPHISSGKVHVQQVDPAELSPGELIASIRAQVEAHNARLIIIDSLNGYLQAMPEEQFLTAQLHEVLSYLRQQGVVTILIMAQHGLLGHMTTPLDVSYLADTVVLTRYFEAEGRVRKAISVAKKRTGRHEDTVRELGLELHGLRVGEPLSNVHGGVTAASTYGGGHQAATLMDGARE